MYTTALKPKEINFLNSALFLCGLRDSLRRDNCCLPYTHASCRDSPGKVHAIPCREINTKALTGLSAESQEMAATHSHFYNAMKMKSKN